MMNTYILEYDHLDEAIVLLGHEIPYKNLKNVSTIIVELYEEEYEAIKEAGYNIVPNAPSQVLAFPANLPGITSYPVYPTYIDDYFNIKEFNTLGFDGTGVKLALIDSGCQDANAVLNDPVKFTRVDLGYGVVDEANPSHGSRGCNIVGQVKQLHAPQAMMDIGICYGAEIFSYQGLYGTSSVVEAIDDCISRGVDVINISLALFGSVTTAINAAMAAGIIVVCASGNSTIQNVAHPANIPGVIAINGVAAGTATTPFGSYITTDGHTQVTITSYCEGHYEFRSGGTSQTAWMVSGMLTLLKQKYPSLNTEKAIHYLKRRALPMDGKTYNLPSHTSTKGVLENYQTGAGFMAPLL